MSCVSAQDAADSAAPTPPAQVLGGDVRAKHEGELPFWCSDRLETFLQLVSVASDPDECRGVLRRRALVHALIDDGGLDWGCEWAALVVQRIRQSRAAGFDNSTGKPISSVLPDCKSIAAAAGSDFRDSLVVISFGAAGGGFQLSQDLRRFMLSYLCWDDGLIYHDYASLVGHPQSRLVMGADGVTRQLNDNWNIYFANALDASPVMVIVASESWCSSAWCALERRQRMEVLAAKQAPGGPAAYVPSAASSPGAAGAAGAGSEYLRRQAELETELERLKGDWDRSARSMEDVNESVFRSIAFGNQRGRCEVYLFVDDPRGSSASAELRHIHARVAESQRFYYLPGSGMSEMECALELHSLCVRVTELIDDQATRESFGSGSALYDMITADDMPSAQRELLLRQQRQHKSGLWRLRLLASKDAAAAETAAQAERQAYLLSRRDEALGRGLLFDTGPCPF